MEDAGEDGPPNLKVVIRSRCVESRFLTRFLASHSCLIRLAAVKFDAAFPASSASATTGMCRSCSCSNRLRSLGCKGGSNPRSRSAASRFSLDIRSEGAGGTRFGERGEVGDVGGGERDRNLVEIILIIVRDFCKGLELKRCQLSMVSHPEDTLY